MPVYIIRAGANGPVKIGWTTDVKKRLMMLQISHWKELQVLRTFEGGHAEEVALHLRFADLRIRGEWFSFSRKMLGDVGLKTVEAVEMDKLRPPHFMEGDARFAVADALRSWMAEHDLTEDDLAALLECSPGTVRDWLRYGNQPQFKFQAKLRELSDGELFPELHDGLSCSASAA